MKNKFINPIGSIALIFCLMLSGNTIYCQQSNTDSNANKLKLFEGEWKLKNDIWKSRFDSKYNEDVNPNRSFIARAVSPENTILWNADFGSGSWAILLWTYHKGTGRVNHISNTEDNNIGIGAGEFDNNNNLKIKIVYPNGCTKCHRIYTYHWNTPDEFDFKATIYKDDKPTGDFYGATFQRK
jgi:hypothetical protein